MTIRNKVSLKAFFEDSDTPTGSNFADLIDSLVLIDPTNTFIGEGEKEFRVQGSTRTTQNSEEFKVTGPGGSLVSAFGIYGLRFPSLTGSVAYASIDLPTWDMQTEPFINVDASAFLTRENVLDIRTKIYADSGDVFINNDGLSLFMSTISANGVITIQRDVGSPYNSSNYNSTASSRGRLLIAYNLLD